jgi:predicted MFS family arabinose efflux permease
MPEASLWRLPGVRRLSALVALEFTSFCLMLASLPSWAVAGGTDAGSAGLVTTAMMLTTVAVQTTVPALVGRFGLARVLAAGLVLLGGPAPLYAATQDLGWLLAVSAVRGCGFAVLTVLGASMAARVAPSSRQGESIGIYGLSIAVPNLVAVPAGAALALSGRFAWAAVLGAAPLLALPLVRPLSRDVSSDRTDMAPRRPRGAVLAAATPSLVLLVVTLVSGGLVTFLPIERPEGSVTTIALLGFGISGALSRWRAGALADRVGSRMLLPGSLAVAVAGLLMVAAGLAAGHSAGAAALVVAGATVFGAGYGAVLNLSLLVAFARAGRDATTTASAVWNAAFDVGTAVGAVAVGWVAVAGPGLPVTLAGCAVAIFLTVPLALAATAGGSPAGRATSGRSRRSGRR